MSTESAVLDLARDIERFALRSKQKKITITTRQDVADRFLNEEKQLYQMIVERFGLEISFDTSRVSIAQLEEALYDIGT